MPEAQTLNATQGSLLGLLHDRPKTGWELVQAAKAGLARFWNVTQSHVYRELGVLEARKLIKAGPAGPRDRRPFTITAAGKRAFRTWINEEPGPEQLRFPLLVTLWFGDHLDDATIATFIDKARTEHSERLAHYRRMHTDDPHIAAVVSFGVHYEQAVLDWLDALDY